MQDGLRVKEYSSSPRLVADEGVKQVFAWVCGYALTPFCARHVVQSLIIFNQPDTYLRYGWHGTLLAWAFNLSAIL